MPSETRCPECGCERPGHAPDGLCPRCLMGVALGPDSAGQDAAGPLSATPDVTRMEADEAPLATQAAAGIGAGPAPTPTLPGVTDPTVDQSERRQGECPGHRIGPFKLLQEIGEGGMGTVFMAEQAAPIRRMVALKLVKAGLDTRQVIARFEAERQALALMDHPNIARVFDAGTAESGRPYFVMELVKGIPITRYCDERRLTPRERLELFIPICHAVQHAHQKGIIHRDLKPSNVLVALYDGRPVPKVIDFGVAKATGPRLTDRTLFTEFGAIVGTPEYMSPEQAELNQLDVDTRSDVYGLGVLLYELLTGTTPLERKRLTQAALLEVLRIIRDEEPPLPSTRLATTEELPSIAASRNVEPDKLRGQVRGELDWIVMKCLEKNRDRRYETATGLALDLERYLHDEPVAAGPPSSGYRLRKFARRNRKMLTMAGVVVTALVVGMALSTWQAVRATRAEGLAENSLEAERAARREADRLLGEVKQQSNRADLARQEADRRATEANEVVDFLINDMIGAAAPSRTEGKVPTVDQVLARADESIARRFADRPLIEATIRLALARAYEELGQPRKSEQHAARAVELRLAHFGPTHAESISAQNALGVALIRQGTSQAARTLLTPVLENARRDLGPEHRETLQAMHVLAWAHGDLDRGAARTLMEELLEISKRVRRPEHPATLATMHNLANNLREVEPERAAELYERVLAVELRDRPNHPNTLIAMGNLATHYLKLKKRDRALDLMLRAIEAQMRVLGVAHPITRNSIKSYFVLAGGRREILERARMVMERELERARRAFGPTSRAATAGTDLLATVLVLLGRSDEAVALIDGLPADHERLGAPELHLRTRLALVLRDHGRFDAASRLLEGALAEALRLRDEATKPDPLIEEVRGIAQVLLSHWPGLAAGIRPEERPPAAFTIEAPFRAAGPVADGRISPGEYGPGVDAGFDDDTNPGRLYAWGKSDRKQPDDLGVSVHAAYTARSLYLAFRVRDQFVRAGEAKENVPIFYDSVEVFINGDRVANDMTFVNSVNPIGDREGFQIVADAAGHQLTIPESFKNADWKVGASRTPDGYIVEFEIPLALIDTRDGPGSVPASGGSELLVNFGINDVDGPQSGEAAYAIFWAEDPTLSPFYGGEDLWTVSLRLVPDPTPDPPPADPDALPPIPFAP
jgi:serine/threonine protein kinase/tetratricopeptide (TPR) repeat protein